MPGPSCGWWDKSDYWGERCQTSCMSTQAPPEAAGPGVERGDGAIIYGDQTRPRVVIDGLPTPEERRRNAQMPSGAQCRHCQGIPLSVLTGLQAELESARKAARR